ncbi:hypothetical protein EZV62_021599 [Acer yangbiense]|uniref:Uncharacterized protein n=1 Tax=Acer yangbiense TaxID=1000413 RepID=A0A5C7H630_9ROSI|nr:hypothetical protein EZV62_021599 [Acer yangbiense]
MAFSGGLKLVLLVISMIMLAVEAQVDQVQASFNLVAETVLEWPWTTMLPVYDHELVGDGDGDGDEEQDVGIEIGFLAQLVQGGLTTTTIVSKPDTQPTPTPEAAPQSPIAGDRFAS